MGAGTGKQAAIVAKSEKAKVSKTKAVTPKAPTKKAAAKKPAKKAGTAANQHKPGVVTCGGKRTHKPARTGFEK